MQLLSLSKLALLVPCFGCALAEGAARFFPDTNDLKYQDYISPLPTQYNLSDSQDVYLGGYTNSYWSSSFILGSDRHEYLLLSHVLVSENLGVYRASILDITDPSFYNQFSTFYNTSDIYINNKTGFSFAFDDYYMGLSGENRLGPITTWSTNENVTFNVTYELSAPFILNAGAGTFQWQLSSVVNEWSMPAGKMSGSFERNGEAIQVDAKNSFSWYDRQWQVGSASNWTWYELHLQKESHSGVQDEKMSIWFFPSGYDNTTKGYASVRKSPGIQTLVPATLKPGSKTWSSPYGWTYNLDWTVNLLDGTTLTVSTTRDDQELSDSAGIFRTYEGFANVRGVTKCGETIRGYGLVEIQPVTS